ncbi:MAG TPA: prolyl oligopeptidase family serine peptidase [Terriglobia bacterium]|nr:prolyl oligopeptidase family serine peptidase [Terriglobia bacterium]
MHGYRSRLIGVGVIFLVSISLGTLVTQEVRRIPLRPEQLVAATGIHEFTWSPDSKYLAYIGPAAGGFDVHTIGSTGGQARRITSTLRYKNRPAWSPDGKWIGFIAVQDNGNKDLRAVSIDGQSTLTLTDTLAQEEEFVWAPDSNHIAFTQRVGPLTSIMSVDLQTSAVRKLADGPAWNLQWSPDGKWIAFVADLLQPDDDSRENEDIFLIPAEGGSPRLLTPGTPRFRDASPDWASDSRRIVYSSNESGFSNLMILDTQTGVRQLLTTGTIDNLSPKWSPNDAMIAYVRHESSMFHVYTIAVADSLTVRVSERDGTNGGNTTGYAGHATGPFGMIEWSPDGKRIAFTHADPARTSDVWIAVPDGARPIQLTNSMPEDLRRESRFVWPDGITYRSFDGQEIPALVYKPRGTRPRDGYPAILLFRDTLDGGNAATWDPLVQFVVSNGYLVFAPNVRGSGGHGRDFRELVVNNGGDHDIRDALIGLDRLSSESLIDDARLGVMGAGTGGFLTAAALIRSDGRFKAAVAINAILDAVTAASNPDTEEWARYMIGPSPLETPTAYYERSLVNFVDELHTPIVFFYAGHNSRAPFQQLHQFAVQAEVRGRWYDYRVFENESGDWGTWRAANTRFALEAIEAVFERYLLGREREVRLSRNR